MWFRTPTVATRFELSALELPQNENARTMKMANSTDESGEPDDEMRSEYDFRKLQGAIRGKYADAYKEQDKSGPTGGRCCFSISR